MASRENPHRPLPTLMVGLAGLWLLAGAYFKLFEGSPAALPEPVRAFAGAVGLSLGLAYKLIITIEICVAVLGLLWPRVGWLPLAGALVTFVAILATMLGEESCGCFGPDFPVAPPMMLAADATILVAMLATRPWAPMGRGKPSPVLLVLGLAVGVGLPWIYDKEVGGTVELDGAPVRGAYVELDIESWVGMDVWDTKLAEFLDFEAVIPEGLWVLYRSTCDHCARHLESLAAGETGERFLTLIRLKEPNDTEANRVVHVKPSGAFVQEVELPDTVTYLITTPGDLELEGGRIVRAEEGAAGDDDH